MERKIRSREDPQGRADFGSVIGDLEPIESLVAEPLAPGDEPTVLIGTKDLRVRAFGATILQAAGFRVEVASQGSRILSLFRSHRPDLILTDDLLDDMHALRLCSQIRELRGGEIVPVLVLSDLRDASSIRSLMRLDFTDIVLTPVHWKLLSFRVHRWITTARKFRALTDHEQDLAQFRDSAVKASTELIQLRNYDPVTGLPNREMFLSSVGLVLSQIRHTWAYAAVLLLDIDHFREVNALVGRPIANELLRLVAKRLQDSLYGDELLAHAGQERAVGSIARLAADQFAVLLTTLHGPEGAMAVAERLAEALGRTITIGDRDFHLKSRLGIADSSSIESEGEEVLLQRAEIAMRTCKHQTGKSVAFFESSMNDLVVRKVELQEELRRALDENELFLAYQFLVDSQTAIPDGVEALIRWQHPTRGVVPPRDFLPTAEESDLIVEIDRWVLRAGCRQAKRWLDRGWPPLLLSLNLSMRFLEEDDFAQQVLAVLEETGFPASSLQLELSERGTLPDAGRIMSQFEALVIRGIRLAIDDFGTGQTSLSYLRTLPIRCVKVDQSFVRRAPEDSASAAIVTAIAAMSEHLGLKVVAEGVETQQQWQFLASTGCHTLQGFLFSRPETEDVMAGLLESASNAPKEGSDDPVSWPTLQEPSWDSSSDRSSSDPAELPRPVAGAGSTEPTSSIAEPDQAMGRAPGFRAEGLPGLLGGHRETEPVPDWISGGAGSWSKSEAYLLHLARRDFLTQLYNRFSFDEQLEQSTARAERYGHRMALLVVDLDDFKYVNDTHGHAVGDGLLVAIADRLKILVRSSDMLARIGGDEFSVILSEFQDLGDVAEFAGRLLSRLAEPVYFENRELRVTCSLGISIFPTGAIQTRDMVRQADLALYKAKNLGGNSFRFFAHEMGEEVQRGLELARDLVGAVDRGELMVEYQPRVDLRDGRIVGVEALLRWRHPREGLIGPGSFIPIAEHSGEIRAIGRWVIGQACEQASRWKSSLGREIPVSVNLSVVQCRDETFGDHVVEVLRVHELSPELLDFELTESLLARLPQDQEEVLHRLSGLGVGLTLDNFGSGDSALSHFQRFRFDRLKIHQSLIRSIGEPSIMTSVLKGILAMAKKMNVQIIAEGIETREEHDSLRVEGCDAGQGFLFSKPLPADGLLAWMHEWERGPI